MNLKPSLQNKPKHLGFTSAPFMVHFCTFSYKIEGNFPFYIQPSQQTCLKAEVNLPHRSSNVQVPFEYLWERTDKKKKEPTKINGRLHK
jgi:hypothetical protein